MAVCYVVDFPKQHFPENQIRSTFRMEFFQLVYSCICRFVLLEYGIIQSLFGNFPVYHTQNCSLYFSTYQFFVGKKTLHLLMGYMLQKRYWTLVSSSLAHADINHLLCNISALAANGPLFESFVGFSVALLFFCLASAVSGLISLKVHGHPSIGSSGVIYAIDGFLIRLVDSDWRFYVVDYALFYLATTDDGIDHVGHAGGFLFGYLIRDIVLYQKHLF
jgi:membrane associated rhomboid family serine protease